MFRSYFKILLHRRNNLKWQDSMLQNSETSTKNRSTSIFQHQQQQTKNGALREHLNLAFRNINEIAPQLINKYGKEAKTLDLSHNQFQYPFYSTFCTGNLHLEGVMTLQNVNLCEVCDQFAFSMFYFSAGACK